MITKMKTIAATTALAAMMTLGAQAASAATITYSSWVDTDSPSISPIITISDTTSPVGSPVGSTAFLVDVTLATGSLSGSIITMYFDVGTDYGSMAVTDCCYDPTDLASTSGVVAPSTISSQENLNGVDSAITGLFDFALSFDKTDEVGTNSLSFKLTDANGVLDLNDFYYMGLRVQEVGADGEASDKLVATATPGVVPLPAAGWLLLMGIGGLGGASRRRRKAQHS
jgi:hypothetical protein